MKSGSKRQSLWILSTEKSCNVKASNFRSLTNILAKAPCRQKLKEPLLILTNMFSELPLSACPNNSIKYQLKRGTKVNSEAEKQLAPARLSHKAVRPIRHYRVACKLHLYVRVITFPLRALLAPPFIPTPHDAEEGARGQSPQAQRCHMDWWVAASPC